jgi:hypothetical protein
MPGLQDRQRQRSSAQKASPPGSRARSLFTGHTITDASVGTCRGALRRRDLVSPRRGSSEKVKLSRPSSRSSVASVGSKTASDWKVHQTGSRMCLIGAFHIRALNGERPTAHSKDIWRLTPSSILPDLVVESGQTSTSGYIASSPSKHTSRFPTSGCGGRFAVAL